PWRAAVPRAAGRRRAPRRPLDRRGAGALRPGAARDEGAVTAIARPAPARRPRPGVPRRSPAPRPRRADRRPRPALAHPIPRCSRGRSRPRRHHHHRQPRPRRSGTTGRPRDAAREGQRARRARHAPAGGLARLHTAPHGAGRHRDGDLPRRDSRRRSRRLQHHCRIGGGPERAARGAARRGRARHRRRAARRAVRGTRPPRTLGGRMSATALVGPTLVALRRRLIGLLAFSLLFLAVAAGTRLLAPRHEGHLEVEQLFQIGGYPLVSGLLLLGWVLGRFPLIASLVLLAGIFSHDRNTGYARIYTVRPVSRLAIYGSRFAVLTFIAFGLSALL